MIVIQFKILPFAKMTLLLYVEVITASLNSFVIVDLTYSFIRKITL